MDNFGTVTDIVENNQGLVVSIVSKFGIKGSDFDDAVSEGNIGLLRAANKVVDGVYDPSRSALSTFLGLWISQGVRRFLKNNSVVHVPEYAQGNGVTVSVGTIADDYDPADTTQGENLSSDTSELLECLSVADRAILIDSVVTGLTNTEIGNKHGKSREWVRQRVAKLTAKVRENASA